MSMAQVQRPPSFPKVTYLGRPEQRPSPAIALPPIQAAGAATSGTMEARTLPPIHLPPVHAPSRPAGPSVPDIRKVSIDQLLTQSSPTQPGAQPYALSSSTGVGYGHQAPRITSYGPTPQSPPTPEASLQAPLSRQPPLMYVNQQDPSLRVYGGTGHDRPQYSPATASRSPASSCYDSEPSPRTSVVSTSRPRISQPPPLNYMLSIRQQPVAARACGFGERDRRVIDPPPILELKITDRETGRPENDWNAMLALQCTLLSPDGRDDETEVPPTHPDLLSTRRLMGTLVASPYPAKDEHGVAGTFFVFPDLSCRSPGKYRLRFKLMRIDPAMMMPGMSSPSVANVATDVFSVYTAKDFPGMRASSALLKSLRRQGLNVGVKKGSEARKGKSKAKKETSSSDDDESSDGSDDGRRGSGLTVGSGTTSGVSPKSKASKKKPKRKRGGS